MPLCVISSWDNIENFYTLLMSVEELCIAHLSSQFFLDFKVLNFGWIIHKVLQIKRKNEKDIPTS